MTTQTREELTYREATTADAGQMAVLGLASYGQYFPLLSPEAQEKLRAGVNDPERYVMLLNTSKGFVCTQGEKLVGMAFLVPSGNPWDIFQADWSYIRMVGVDPAYSGKGIAKKLTRSCIDYARKNNEKIIALHTSEIMNAARHIYESFGFKIRKEIEPRLGKRYWLYMMEL
jgi:ribosomal protein S18 acetylase RimI-like enzyme